MTTLFQSLTYTEPATYYKCQVPGCGSSVLRLWNHIHQTHKALSAEEKKQYLSLSKAIGPEYVVDLSPKVEPKTEKGDSSSTDNERFNVMEVPIVSMGRQRYGSTKDMKAHDLNSPELTAFYT